MLKTIKSLYSRVKNYFTSKWNAWFIKSSNGSEVNLSRQYMDDLAVKHEIIPNDSSSHIQYDQDVDNLFRTDILAKLKEFYKENKHFSPLIVLHVLFKHVKEDKTCTAFFHAENNWPIRSEEDIETYIDKQIQYFIIRISQFEARDSGWIYQNISKVDMRLRKWSPSTGSSYLPLPQQIQSTRAYVNVRNTDNLCFKYAILSALHPASQHTERVSKYKEYLDTLNWDGLDFPLSVDKAKFQHFEAKNPELPALNIHILNNLEDKLPFPYYTSVNNDSNSEDAINILYFQKANESNGHYCWMKNPARALSKLTNHNGKSFPCVKCYNIFDSRKKLEDHSPHCRIGESPQQQTLPEPKNCPRCIEYNDSCDECKRSIIMKFEKYYTKQIIPIKIYYDFEAITLPISEETRGKAFLDLLALPQVKIEKTVKKAKQIPSGYCISFGVANEYAEIFKDWQNKVITYTGTNPGEHFITTIRDECKKISSIINETNIPMQKIKPTKERTCHICENEIQSKIVYDHDHLTGKFRGVAHDTCNEKYTLKNKPIPVICHNFKGYDSKMFIKDIGKFKDLQFNPLVENCEKIKSMTVRDRKHGSSFIFIDSFAHLTSSIEKLTENLADFKGQGSYAEFIENTNVDTLRQHFPNVSASFKNDKRFKMLLRKGVFPYSWFTSLEKLSFSKILKKEDFYNDLNDKPISDEDYNFYLNIWEEFNMKTFREYYDLYLLLDTLLLNDICTQYTHVVMNMYKVDPFWYITLPSLSWQAALKLTNVKLELLTDIDMYNFFKSGIRGGVSYIATKYALANNKDMRNYDRTKESSYIDYIDMNNLYGWAMMQPLPVGDFEWVNAETIFPNDKNYGYVYEADLEYPKDLHDFHNDFPMMPEKFRAPGATAEKLVPSLLNREKYIVDGEALNFYVSQGIKLIKIHRCLKYRQSPWLKPYIKKNTEARAKSTNEFQKNFYKLANNSVYGQTLMDVTKFVDFELVTSPKQYKNRLRKPYLIKSEPYLFPCTNHQQYPMANSCSTEQSCVVAMEKIKRKVVLNRPIYLGFKILELAKIHMYDFWYNVLKERYKNRVCLLGTDTDSFIYELKCDDISQELGQFKDIFDFSNYDKDHPSYNDTHKKVPGKMKREFPMLVIEEFVGLQSKCYSMKFHENKKKEIKVAKGVNSSKLQHSQYLHVLETKTTQEITEKRLQSKSQQMYVIQQQKTALDCSDDKRVWIGELKSPKTKEWGKTLAWGHKDLQQ